MRGASGSGENPGPGASRYLTSGCNGKRPSAFITYGRVIESTAMSYDIDRLSSVGAATPESRFRCTISEELPIILSRENRLSD